ncbi:MAG: DUF192 domain-containing protein [Pseudonocardiales bacterium]|nr:DUF192 domain-containing protein [Pseudonocardiales bacterium]
MRAVNRTRGVTLGTRVGFADRWWLRARGLLGRKGLQSGEGLLLRPCRAVHMLGMAFPLDVAFLDSNGKAVALYHRLNPGALTRWHRCAIDVLELPAGTLARTATVEGDIIVCSAEEF